MTTENACEEKVYRGAWAASEACGKPVKDTVDGKELCGVHARSARTRIASAKRWEDERVAARDAEVRRKRTAERLGIEVGWDSDPSRAVVSLDALDRLRWPT